MLMEKSPPNLIRMRFLQALFPDSAFVVIMRHPIPVSLATQKWSDTKPHSLIEHWLRAHELMAEDVPHVRRVHVMRYEDLVAEPDSELRAAFGFLGLEDHGAGRTTAEGLNTDNFHADRTLRTGVNDRYFDDWYGPRRHTVVRRAYYELTERRYEGRARHFGYSLRRPHELRTPTLRLPGLSDRGPRPRSRRPPLGERPADPVRRRPASQRDDHARPACWPSTRRSAGSPTRARRPTRASTCRTSTRWSARAARPGGSRSTARRT